MVLSERNIAISTIVTTLFLKLLMLPVMYSCAPHIGDYALSLYFVPDGAIIGLFWIPVMLRYARRVHMDYTPITSTIASLYTLTIVNAASTPLLFLHPPATVPVSLILYAVSSLAVADLVLASLLLPVRSYTIRHLAAH